MVRGKLSGNNLVLTIFLATDVDGIEILSLNMMYCAQIKQRMWSKSNILESVLNSLFEYVF